MAVYCPARSGQINRPSAITDLSLLHARLPPKQNTARDAANKAGNRASETVEMAADAVKEMTGQNSKVADAAKENAHKAQVGGPLRMYQYCYHAWQYAWWQLYGLCAMYVRE